MNFWDRIKPSKPAPQVTQVELSPDKRELLLGWDDGAATKVTARTLRQRCPCAACVDEWTKELRHDPEKIPASTTIQGVQPVGNYALAFTFSDSHTTGIYGWAFL